MSEDIFDRLDAKDGFHVVQIDDGMSLSLHVQAYGGGELHNLVDTANPESATALIHRWMGPSVVDHGECNRLRLVLDAVARYLTTGGCWEELAAGMKVMSKIAINGFAFNGYHISESYVTYEAVYQHIFVKNDDSGTAILWEEPTHTERGGVVGGFIDRTTLAELKAQQDHDDESETDDDWEGESSGTVDEAGEDRPAVQVLGITDLPTANESDGSPE